MMTMENNGFELIEQEANSVLSRAQGFMVDCDEDYAEAGAFVLGCKQLIAKIKGDFSEPKRKADEAHKAITAMEKRMLAPVEQAISIAGGAALAYKREQDRLAKEEADRIAADKKRADDEARLKEAERLEAECKTQEAEAVIAAPSPPAPRPMRFVSPAPKVAGLSTKKQWKGRIVDPSLVKINYRLPDQTLINRKVQSFFNYVKNPTAEQIAALADEIGGVVIEEVETFAGRVAR